MLGVAVVLYGFFLVAGIIGRYRPLPMEQRVGDLGFVMLSSVLFGRGFPLIIVPILTFLSVVFLQRAR